MPQTLEQLLATGCRQAITTRFLELTNRRDSRVVARCEARAIHVPWDDALDVIANHAAAALRLMRMLGWDERNALVMGGMRDGYVFVQITPSEAR